MEAELVLHDVDVSLLKSCLERLLAHFECLASVADGTDGSLRLRLWTRRADDNGGALRRAQEYLLSVTAENPASERVRRLPSVEAAARVAAIRGSVERSARVVLTLFEQHVVARGPLANVGHAIGLVDGCLMTTTSGTGGQLDPIGMPSFYVPDASNRNAPIAHFTADPAAAVGGGSGGSGGGGSFLSSMPPAAPATMLESGVAGLADSSPMFATVGDVAASAALAAAAAAAAASVPSGVSRREKRGLTRRVESTDSSYDSDTECGGFAGRAHPAAYSSGSGSGAMICERTATGGRAAPIHSMGDWPSSTDVDRPDEGPNDANGTGGFDVGRDRGTSDINTLLVDASPALIVGAAVAGENAPNNVDPNPTNRTDACPVDVSGSGCGGEVRCRRDSAHAITRVHDDVSRTVSDTLRAEFAEYVCTAKVELHAVRTHPRYEKLLRYGTKIGYSKAIIELALQRIGLDVAENDFVAELIHLSDGLHPQSSCPVPDIGLLPQTETRVGVADEEEDAAELSGCRPNRTVGGAAQARSVPAVAGASMTGNAMGSAAAAAVGTSQKAVDAAPSGNGLRAIVIDGSNVAMSHGHREVFSCRGIQICVKWFLERGHSDVTAFVPRWRKEASRPNTPISDQDVLFQLERDKILTFTPSRNVGGKRVVCYEDRYVLNLAAQKDAVIVSNDTYRDLVAQNPTLYRKLVEERLLMYSFVNDTFMPPDDPLGRDGPTLDEFLRVSPLASTVTGGLGDVGAQPQAAASAVADDCTAGVVGICNQQQMQQQQQQPIKSIVCPYSKKCTYGNKCKFLHPERGNVPPRLVSERLAEQARLRSQQSGGDNVADESHLRTRSVPLTTGDGFHHQQACPVASAASGGGSNSSACGVRKKQPVSRTKSLVPPMSRPLSNDECAAGGLSITTAGSTAAAGAINVFAMSPAAASCSVVGTGNLGRPCDNRAEEAVVWPDGHGACINSRNADLLAANGVVGGAVGRADAAETLWRHSSWSNLPVPSRNAGGLLESEHLSLAKKLSDPVTSHHSLCSSEVDFLPANRPLALAAAGRVQTASSAGFGGPSYEGARSTTSDDARMPNANTFEGISRKLHKELERQLTLNPECDNRLPARRPEDTSHAQDGAVDCGGGRDALHAYEHAIVSGAQGGGSAGSPVVATLSVLSSLQSGGGAAAGAAPLPLGSELGAAPNAPFASGARPGACGRDVSAAGWGSEQSLSGHNSSSDPRLNQLFPNQFVAPTCYPANIWASPTPASVAHRQPHVGPRSGGSHGGGGAVVRPSSVPPQNRMRAPLPGAVGVQQQQQQPPPPPQPAAVASSSSSPFSSTGGGPPVTAIFGAPPAAAASLGSVASFASVPPPPPTATSAEFLVGGCAANVVCSSGGGGGGSGSGASAMDERSRVFYHLASIFPKDQVQAAMEMNSNETKPSKICAAILDMLPPGS